MKNIYIVRLKYSPGDFKEFRLIGQQWQKNGYRVRYFLSKGYEWLASSCPDMEVTFVTKSVDARTMMLDCLEFFLSRFLFWLKEFRKSPPALLSFYHPHPLNFLVAFLVRLSGSRGLICMYIHEPSKDNAGTMAFYKKLYFMLLEFLQSLSLRFATNVILPSPYAVELFLKRYPGYKGEVTMIPLLVPDRAHSVRSAKRKYFTMSGKLFPDGRLEAFLDLVRTRKEKGLDIHFQLVTSSQLPQAVVEMGLDENNALRIINKKKLSDEEINQAINESFAVLTLHTQGTQSGVTPVAYMNGTPVIARNIPGFAQFIKDNETGVLVSPQAKSEDWFNAIQQVMGSFDQMSKRARGYYLDCFAPENWQRYYQPLLSKLENQKGILKNGG